MAEYYKNVHGWFTFKNLYSMVAHSIPQNGTIVEVGVWCGKSIIYLAELLKELKKDVVIYAVDTWEGAPDEPEQAEFIKNLGQPLYDHFLSNIKMAEVDNMITPIRLPSIQAANKFTRQSLDFVFVDGDHRGGMCFQDVARWWQKIRVNGLIAGHDYSFPDVQNDLNDYFGRGNYQFNTNEDIWFKIKETD